LYVPLTNDFFFKHVKLLWEMILPEYAYSEQPKHVRVTVLYMYLVQVLGSKYTTCLLHRNVYHVPNTIFSSFQVTCIAKGVYVLHIQSTLH